MNKSDAGIWIITDLNFWIEVAEVRDTYGVPKDLIMLKLREHGVEFTDEQFHTLIDYLIMRRNGEGQTIDVTTILIKLPDHWDREGIFNEWISQPR